MKHAQVQNKSSFEIKLYIWWMVKIYHTSCMSRAVMSVIYVLEQYSHVNDS